MPNPLPDKALLKQHIATALEAFKQNHNHLVTLPVVSSMWNITHNHETVSYTKEIVRPSKETAHCVKFIKKKERVVGTIWETSAENIKKAIRWGIVTPESVTGKSIAALGQYRITAHRRVLKGIISNAHCEKSALLDNIQARFEALQALESCVNSKKDLTSLVEQFDHYINTLRAIQKNLSTPNTNRLTVQTMKQPLHDDLEADIQRANTYKKKLQSAPSLKPFLRATGVNSILEFVKSQMIRNLYQMQAYNQDLTYHLTSTQALTRGVLNDYIEDARKIIDDHEADPRNQTLDAHHGNYHTPVYYDFSTHTPDAQRQALLAISYIEEWDRLETNPNDNRVQVKNADDQLSDPLDQTRFTNWRVSKTPTAFIKKIAYAFWNMLKSIVTTTMPWEECAWGNKDFISFAETLRAKGPKREPLGYKILHILEILGRSLRDFFYGIKNTIVHLSIQLPRVLREDWLSTTAFEPLDIISIQKDINTISTQERERLQTLLNAFKLPKETVSVPDNTPLSIKAEPFFHLTSGEKNDLLTAVARGLDEFTSIFTHHIFAHNPVSGLAFTTLYVMGGIAILAPQWGANIMGTSYVQWCQSIGYDMAASPLSAAIAFGSSQGQLATLAIDTLTTGPSSSVVKTTEAFMQDPITIAAYGGAAYGLGYVLAHGIAGYPIPWLSEHMEKDLGQNPSLGYPVLGGKLAIMLHAALNKPTPNPFKGPLLPGTISKSNDITPCLLVAWLSQNATHLPKLPIKTKFSIERQLYETLPTIEARALSKLLYPEKPVSISEQIITIPLGYIPRLLRLLCVPFISLAALIKGRPNAAAPIKRATIDLVKKIQKDSVRLAMFIVKLTKVIYQCVTSVFKALAFTLNFIIARIAGCFGFRPAHAMHEFFASAHLHMKTYGEQLYPSRATKHVETPHPADVVLRYQPLFTHAPQHTEQSAQADVTPDYTY